MSVEPMIQVYTLNLNKAHANAPYRDAVQTMLPEYLGF